MSRKANGKTTTLWLCVTAFFTAMNVVLSSFSIPVPGGHLYLNNIAICTASLLFDPLCAFIVGGVGSFLGDFFFYPTPMFVSLVSHGLQAVIISLISQKTFKKHENAGNVLALTAGGVIAVVGYTLGRAFIYATPIIALEKIPYEILQVGVGALVAFKLCKTSGLKRVVRQIKSE